MNYFTSPSSETVEGCQFIWDLPAKYCPRVQANAHQLRQTFTALLHQPGSATIDPAIQRPIVSIQMQASGAKISIQEIIQAVSGNQEAAASHEKATGAGVGWCLAVSIAQIYDGVLCPQYNSEGMIITILVPSKHLLAAPTIEALTPHLAA